MKKTMGQRIKEVIEEQGLTLEAFGKPLGVTKESVSYWVNDRTKDLKNANLFRIEDVYGISARWIATGEGEKHINKIADAKGVYSATTRAIADMIETLDEEGKRAIQEDVEKEKRLQEMKAMIDKLTGKAA